ncbi:MAG: outer membrane beta-barrel protein [Sediminibacterium sp.]
MKKIILITSLFISLTVSAQEKFGIGIKVGQNFSSVNSVAVDRHAASYHGGVTAQIGLTEKISLVPELLLSQTKLSTNPSIIDVLGDNNLKPETYHLNYLMVPLLVQVKPFSGLLLQAGPQYGILLDQKKDGIENAQLAFKQGEFSFVGGAKLNLGGFFVYGRYVVGLQNINDLQDQAKWKTTQWQLGLGMNLFGF